MCIRDRSVTVNWNEVTNATVHNVLKKFRVTVAKTDRETGTPQGDATLAGAVYGIYDGDTLIDTYTTDGNGSFTTKYYVCGDNWTIREISPSEGYLLDETSYQMCIRDRLEGIVADREMDSHAGILHHEESVDLIPSNIELAGLEVMLVNAMSRELTLKNYLNKVKSGYDYVLIDCMPSLGMLTINRCV